MKNTTMTETQHQKADAIFASAQADAGGQLYELARYMHGADVTVHVCLWSHDDDGRFVVGENWHVT